MKKLFIVAIFLSIVGCSGGSETIISSDATDSVAESISSVLESYRFVVLDASRSEALIGGMIGKIKKHEQGYFVSCDWKRLLSFDNDGNFRYEINRMGRGPGEYVMLADFDVQGETLAVLDSEKINIHNAVDGAFIRTIPLDFVASNIKIMDDSHYMIYATGHALHLIDDSGKVIKKHDRPDHLSRLYQLQPFVGYQNKLLVQIGASNDFVSYDIDKETFSKARLSGDDRVMTASQEDGYIILYGNDYRQKVSATILTGLASSNSQLMFGRIDGGKEITGYVVDNKSNTIIHLLSERTHNDLTYTSPLFYQYSSISDGGDCFITYVHPYQILEGMEKNSQYADQEHYKWLVENIVPKLSEEGNPVLIEFSFKSE